MLRSQLASLAYAGRLYGTYWRANLDYDARAGALRHPFPRYVQFQTIDACQARCRMCPYPLMDGRFPKGRMDDALFERLLAELVAHPEVSTVVPMLQNEPLLDRRLWEKVAAVKRASAGRLRVELVTNGALLTEQTVDRLRESGLDVLDVSLDAATRETYEQVRPGLDWDAVLAGVERAIAGLPDTTVVVRLVRLRHNAHEVRRFVRRWRRRGVAVFVYDAHDRVGAVPEWNRDLRIDPAREGAGTRLFKRVSRAALGHCPIPFAMTSILHDGTMLLCVHDWERKEVLGNLHGATIAELWNGPRMREIRALVHERRYTELPACRDCSLWKDGWF